MSILVTGSAGFIGSHVVQALKQTEHEIVGVDNLNTYYTNTLKYDRLKWTGIGAESSMGTGVYDHSKQYCFYQADVCDRDKLMSIMQAHDTDTVIHLAAQAGVRYSLVAPMEYVQSNMVGFAAVVEAARACGVGNIIYASSSSVYGESAEGPCNEEAHVDSPLSVYAATKRANELYAYAAAAVSEMYLIGLRFFTVYGPWGRPDMAYYSFADKILAGEEIVIRGGGQMSRDHTYIEDIVKGVLLLQDLIQSRRCVNERTGGAEIFNIGYGEPIATAGIVHELEAHLDKAAIVKIIDERAGEPLVTFADTRKIRQLFDFSPETDFSTGMTRFATWYKEYVK